ncbi:MAG: phosphatidylglycerophosphatase A [Candidatus Omnitrophica bacterium]|nr:phosphatidylglycerophosphatase A [Candidatus Omnitrophota bacterium]
MSRILSEKEMNIRDRIIISLSTFFGVGSLPLPGTAASLLGVFIFYLVKGNSSLHLGLTLFLILSGLLLAGKAEKIAGKKDAGCIVIDEVSGMLLSLLFLPYDIRIVIIGFLLFRILDTLKPYPADRLQSLPGGTGIMSDDIIAAIYANIILQFVFRLASFRMA